MIKLKSKRMISLLNSGIRKARKLKKPSNGALFGLFNKTLKNGWYYQVDYINDKRCHDKPYVSVCAFRPPNVGYARSADYYLEKELTKKEV